VSSFQSYSLLELAKLLGIVGGEEGKVKSADGKGREPNRSDDQEERDVGTSAAIRKLPANRVPSELARPTAALPVFRSIKLQIAVPASGASAFRKR